MLARDFRHAAWERLHGNWGTMALATLVEGLLLGACGALTIFFVGGLATLLLSGALFLGFSIMALNVARGQQVQFVQMFDGFKNYGSALALSLLIYIFTFLWSLLLVFPGIIMSYAYSMSYYILADDPRLGANEARKRSIALMRGHKWRLFCLDFSFIGWWLLCILTLGILSFWVVPYHQTARAAFYRNLVGDNDAPVAEVNVPAKAD